MHRDRLKKQTEIVKKRKTEKKTNRAVRLFFYRFSKENVDIFLAIFLETVRFLNKKRDKCVNFAKKTQTAKEENREKRKITTIENRGN